VSSVSGRRFLGAVGILISTAGIACFAPIPYALSRDGRATELYQSGVAQEFIAVVVIFLGGFVVRWWSLPEASAC
jgi:hypothetical protein